VELLQFKKSILKYVEIEIIFSFINVMEKLNFQHHYSSSVTWNLSNMLIWCLRNISYHQCWCVLML